MLGFFSDLALQGLHHLGQRFQERRGCSDFFPIIYDGLKNVFNRIARFQVEGSRRLMMAGAGKIGQEYY